MAISFLTRSDSDQATIYVRIQKRNPKTNLRISTQLQTENANQWAIELNSKKQYGEFTRLPILNTIEARLNAETNLTAERAKAIIEELVVAPRREEERRKAEAQAKADAEKAKADAQKAKPTFLQFYEQFVAGIKNGTIKSHKGTNCSERTCTNYRQGLNRFKEFCATIGSAPDWDDINVDFLNAYCTFLQARGGNLAYGTNTLHKRAAEIKHILRKGFERGYTNNTAHSQKEFGVAEIEVDSVYLTRRELQMISDLDLSGKAPGYAIARDIFMVGVWTGQRVSDYNNIKTTDIKTDDKGRTFIDFKQKKTGVKVRVPANAQLRAILAKYNNNIPRLTDQVLNRYLKDICRWAGIDEPVTITTTKGGVEQEQELPKWALVHSHTARRTFCTLAYLEGVDIYDIMKISGHQSVNMLKKYIRAAELEMSVKLAEHYAFFQ